MLTGNFLKIEGVTRGINYGSNKVRFTNNGAGGKQGARTLHDALGRGTRAAACSSPAKSPSRSKAKKTPRLHRGGRSGLCLSSQFFLALPFSAKICWIERAPFEQFQLLQQQSPVASWRRSGRNRTSLPQ
ncbi:MAG: hypothetical protein WDM89_19635 [Rhizomicrobium sp.]